ncbi:MAG: hypothetical protein IJR93_02925 [Treponema sp.]|nr:hypothetical protein [Treponema sp.]
MASVYRYDGAGNDVSFINISGKISDCIDADWDQYILLRAGERVTPDLVPEASDIIYMRRIPRGTAVAITLGVVALVGAVGAGVYSYVQQKKINEYQEKLAENQKKMSAGSTVQKLPYVRGASNSPATGHSFPYILGETLFTPYKLCPDHISISGTDGADQYWYMVMECGFSSLCFRKMMLGSNKIISFSGDTPQSGTFSFDQGAYYDAGNFAEIRQTGNFTEPEFNRKVIYSNFMEEIPHRHIPSDATQQEAQEIEDEWRRGLVKQLPDHVMSVEVIIMFDGLRKFDEDDGAWVSASATLQVQWANVDSPEESDWHDFDLAFNQNGTRSNSFSRNARKQLRYSTTQTFTPAQTIGKNVSVRIRRTTPKASGTAKDTVYLMAVQSSIYDAEKSTSQEFVPAMPLEAPQRDKCTRIGIRIKSTSATDGYMDSFSVVQCGCCRTWDGTSWSSAKVPERNLAAWVLEILTSGIHEPSRYLDSELDLGTFGEWYEYCEENGIYADGAVTDATAKKGLIEKLLANGNAALVMNETSGLMEVAVDSGRDYPVALLTSDNMISMTATKTVRRIADGVKVTYVNKDAGYEADSVTFMRDGGGYDPASDTLTTTALSYITDYTQAYRRAWRTMAEEIARPMSATVKVGQGGGFYRLFDCVDLQHDSLSIGLGHGVIRSLSWIGGRLSHIELAGFVDFPASGRCGVIVNCTSTPGVIPLEVTGEGRASVLSVLTEISENAPKIPSPGDTLSFGLLDGDSGFSRITTRMLITGVSPDDDGYTLQLTEYNADVYSYGTLPEYKSNITPRPESTKLSIRDVREYAEPSDVSAAVAALEAGTGETAAPPDSVTGLSASAGESGIELSWGAPGRGLKNSVQKYEVQVTYDRTADEPEWESAGTSKTNSFSFMFQRSVHGYPEADAFQPWAFRIRAVNIYSLASDWTQCVVDASSYGTWILGVPKLEDRTLDRTAILSLSASPQSNRQVYGNIRYHVRIRRGRIDGYHSVKYWMHDTSNDTYWYLLTNSRSPDVETEKDAAWTEGTEADWDADERTDFTSASDQDTDHEYSYTMAEQTIPADTEWHVPASVEDPYASWQNYKTATTEPALQKDRYVSASSTYTQTLPLYFTDTVSDPNNPVLNLVNTPYYFDVRCVSEAGVGPWLSGSDNWAAGHDGRAITALCTNFRDFVKANETAQKAYITELSAITANLGEISEGSLTGDKFNYWLLSNRIGARVPEDYKGAFRVGGPNQYLMVQPVVVGGEIVDYNISLVAQNISFTSSGVDIGNVNLESGTYIYSERGPNIRLHLTAWGITVHRKINPGLDWTGNYTECGTIEVRTKSVNGVTKSSLIISNDPGQVDFGLTVNGVTAYHFAGTVLDENGADSKSLALDGTKLEDDGGYIEEYDIGNGLYGGEISAEQDTQTVVLHKMDSMYVNGGHLVHSDGTVTTTLAEEMNGAASTSWGLTAAQVAARIFTPEEE